MTFARTFLFCIVSTAVLLFLINNEIIPFVFFLVIQLSLILFPLFYESSYPFELWLRVVLLGLPGIFTSLAFAIDPLVYRSHYLALPIQTSLTSAWVSIICILASYGALVGSFTGSRQKIKAPFLIQCQLPVPKKTALVALVFCFLFSIIATFKSGSVVFTGAAYATESYLTLPFDGVIGVLQNLSASFVFIYIYSSISSGNFHLITIPSFLLFVAYLLPIVTGQRADYLVGFFASLLILLRLSLLRLRLTSFLYNNKLASLTFSFLALCVSFVFFRTIAEFRTGLSGNFFVTLTSNFFQGYDFFVINYGYYKVFFTETLNHVVGGLYSFTHKVIILDQPYLLGASYIDFLPRLLPQGMKPTDIQGLEWKTAIGNMVVTQGGIFEGAESFANFSLPGVFLVSFLISKFLSKLRTYLLYAPLPYILYLTVFLESFRYIWYQTFAFARILSLFPFLFVLFSFIKWLQHSNSCRIK